MEVRRVRSGAKCDGGSDFTRPGVDDGCDGEPNRVARVARFIDDEDATIANRGRGGTEDGGCFANGFGAESPADMESVTGSEFDEMLGYLEGHYNDGRQYVLHYVSAREAYNIAMAAVDGRSGNPANYLDYVVPPYLASSRGVPLPVTPRE